MAVLLRLQDYPYALGSAPVLHDGGAERACYRRSEHVRVVSMVFPTRHDGSVVDVPNERTAAQYDLLATTILVSHIDF